MKKENIIDIITDEDGRKIVVITDIRFKGKRKDLGMKKVKKGNLLAFFVNDIKSILKK